MQTTPPIATERAPHPHQRDVPQGITTGASNEVAFHFGVQGR